MKTETVQEVIDILMRVENKSLPLLFRTKHITEEGMNQSIDDGMLDSAHPNSTVRIFDMPEEAVLELLVHNKSEEE